MAAPFVGAAAVACTSAAFGAGPRVVDQIAVDQFGWQPGAKKVAMFAEPVKGQDKDAGYKPGGGGFEVRRAGDGSVALTGKMTAWRDGKMDEVSGNRVWWADLSGLTKPGEYYLIDPAAEARSYGFRIGDDVYAKPLVAAVRTYYYQRCGFELTPRFAGQWTHAACHVGEGQEREARGAPVGDGTEPTGPARDVSGGWHDAGDMNKYVPFTKDVMWNLLAAYEWNPKAFGDDTNIPESGNGVPDLLDDCKYELDWLLRMQLDDGSVCNRVAFSNKGPANSGPAPAGERRPAYYTPPTTWATATFAANCAHAASVYGALDRPIPGYAQRLRAAAERAWAYLAAHPKMLPADGKDGANAKALDFIAGADGSASDDDEARVLAAADLFRLTGDAKYRDYFDAHAGTAHPPALLGSGLAMAWFDYAIAPGATPAVAGRIRDAFKSVADGQLLARDEAGDDPYKSFMFDGYYWGSNQIKCRDGVFAIMAARLKVNPDHASRYREVAAEYLHYEHGRNPLSWCYLSNSSSIGAGKSPVCIFHGWFKNPPYNHGNPAIGPAPGYVVGGPNAFFSAKWLSPPAGEPPMKAFKDWDANWNEQRHALEPSWEVTEPAIYYQAKYVALASQFCPGGK